MNAIPSIYDQLDSLNLSPDTLAKVHPTWELSQRCFPVGTLFFLKDNFIQDVIKTAGLRPEAQPKFIADAVTIRSSNPLSRLAWHYHWFMHVASKNDKAGITLTFPKPGELPGISFISGLVIMAALPRLKAFYLEHGIPLNILQDSATALDIWAEDHFLKHGEWGCDGHWGWIVQFTLPNLFRLHRLEFQFANYSNPFLFFKNNITGRIAAFPPPELNVNQDGFFCQPNEKTAFITARTLNDTTVTGFPVTEKGVIGQHPVTLQLNEWKLLFHDGDPMLNIHIPACAPLSFDECKAGINKARDFFPRYFPDFDFKGFQCGSWLLDPTLNLSLPPTSNILRFQSLFFKYPATDGSNWQIRQRVFGNPDLSMDQVPQKTSLQIKTKQRILNGPNFRNGRGIIPR